MYKVCVYDDATADISGSYFQEKEDAVKLFLSRVDSIMSGLSVKVVMYEDDGRQWKLLWEFKKPVPPIQHSVSYLEDDPVENRYTRQGAKYP